MTELIGGAAVDAAADAFYKAQTRRTGYVPGGYVRRGASGAVLRFTSIPVPELNTVSVDREWDPDEVDAFARELAATGVPWSIEVRGEADKQLAELGARYGRTTVGTRPLMRWDAGPLPAPPAAIPPGATVRAVSGTEAGVFAAAYAAGFDMPRKIADMTSPPALFDAPGIAGFVLDLHGEVVATGLNVMVGDHVGMFSGTVPPQHRRNGYYRVLVTARLAHAFASGARHAVSQTSPMSRPLYESLGFGLAETWTYLTPAA